MSLLDHRIKELTHKMTSNNNPYGVLYQWVRTGHVSLSEFKILLDNLMVDSYNKQQQSKIDIGNPDQFL